MNKDLEHLKILSICYYISAGITAVFSCFPVFHLVIGIAIVSGAFPDDGKNNMPTFLGWFFIGFASIFILCGWAIAIGTFFAGKSIKQQKNYIFCLVMAGLNCMFVPIGTALGVFTFIVLMRDSVKEIFNGRTPIVKPSFDNSPSNWR